MGKKSGPGDQSGDRAALDAAFLGRFGRRVRRFRGEVGLSRKALAEAAGVSERYLAQLESGRGNISILLLCRVGAALGKGLPELVDESGADSDLEALIAQLRGADREAREQVRTVLASRARAPARTGGVALIGLRGAGKSTLGRFLADDIGLPFVELNDRISTTSGLAVTEIFNLYGPKGYRRLERQCLQEIIEREPQVVLASGGGIVSDAATYHLLLDAFFSVWLRATPEEHMARVRVQGDLRPMAGHSMAMDDLRQILETRNALYARADRQLDTSGLDLETCRRALARLIRAESGALGLAASAT